MSGRSAGSAGGAAPSTVALDAMGGDFAPHATVLGAVAVSAEGRRVLLVGDRERLAVELERAGGTPEGVRVVHAPDVIEMGDHAAREVRNRRESSIYVAMQQLKQGEAAAVVTLGNTGAGLAAALVVLGRLPGIERPALGAVLPTPGGSTLLLDAGANAENRASHLVQFAQLGSAYMRSVGGVAEPRVGLLNLGEEGSKGSALTLAAYEVLQASSLRFVGNIEGDGIAGNAADVVVTDGFTGNVALKVMEGTVSMLLGELRGVATASVRGRVGGAMLRPALLALRERLDYRHYGGVPLLGVNGSVFIGHGRSDAHAVANAIRTAADAVDGGLPAAMAAAASDPAPPATD